MNPEPPRTSSRFARWRTWVVRPLLAAVCAALGFLGWNLATGNFATIEPGRVYRSGQLRSIDLARAVRRHGIKTVLNLRGSHPESAWYRAERNATLDAGATQIDIALSSCEWMSRDQARMLLRVLETCEYPLLIHCWRGAERTGWSRPAPSFCDREPRSTTPMTSSRSATCSCGWATGP